MRYIKVPGDATLKSRATKDTPAPTLTFTEFILRDVNGDKRWWSDKVWEDAFDSLCVALEDRKPGEWVVLEDTAHEKLELVVRELPVDPAVKPSLRFFLRAISQADKLDPRVPAS